MDLGLKDKVALVTGAASPKGFGKEIALILAREGCDVAVADLDITEAEKTAGDIESTGQKAIAVKVDVSNRDEVDEMIKIVLEKLEKIDILVNNAGASSPLKPFIEMSKEDWDLDIGVNLY